MKLGDREHREIVARKHLLRSQELLLKANEEEDPEERKKLGLQSALHCIQARLWRKSIEQCDG